MEDEVLSHLEISTDRHMFRVEIVPKRRRPDFLEDERPLSRRQRLLSQENGALQ